MQDHCVIPGVIAGILYCSGGHFHDGAWGAGYMALQHPARQRNEHSGERSLRNYGLPVFESGGAVRLDAVCHDGGLHDRDFSVCIPGCPLLFPWAMSQAGMC